MSSADEVRVPGLEPGLVSAAVAAWGLLFFVSLFSLGLFLSDPGSWLGFAARYWLAAAVLSGASTFAVGRLLAEYYSEALLVAEEYAPGLQPSCKEPRVYDAAADVAQAVAGLEQLSSLWPLAAASFGLLGLYSGVLLYYLVRLATRGLRDLGYSVSDEAPATGSIAALAVATLGIGLLVEAYYVSRILSDTVTSVRSLVEEAETTWIPSVD